MIYPKTKIEEWAKRYKIRLDPMSCPRCERILEWKTPVAFKGYRGVNSEICPEHQEGVGRVVPVGEKVKEWETLLEGSDYEAPSFPRFDDED